MYMSCKLLNGEHNGLSCKTCMYIATYIYMNSYACIHIKLIVQWMLCTYVNQKILSLSYHCIKSVWINCASFSIPYKFSLYVIDFICSRSGWAIGFQPHLVLKILHRILTLQQNHLVIWLTPLILPLSNSYLCLIVSSLYWNFV